LAFILLLLLGLFSNLNKLKFILDKEEAKFKSESLLLISKLLLCFNKPVEWLIFLLLEEISNNYYSDSSPSKNLLEV
jgi:hypothetical protein